MEMDFDRSSEQKRKIITTRLLGNTKVSNAPFVYPDGTPYSLKTDFFGKKRDLENPMAGPFNLENQNTVRLRVWHMN
jgi:alpha-N-arabinofuranosidase